MTIRAEFAEDSRYAAGVYKPELPPGIEKLRFRVVPDRELEAQIRVVDASDRSFQTARTRLAADTHGTLTLDLANGEWPEKWGGKEPSAAAPLLPLKEILLIVNRGPDRSAALRIDAVEAEAPFINGKPFRGEAFRFSAFGCDISGNWTNGTNPKLKLAVTAAGTVRPGTRLAVAFPDMFRDKVVRYEVKPGRAPNTNTRHRSFSAEMPSTPTGSASRSSRTAGRSPAAQRCCAARIRRIGAAA